MTNETETALVVFARWVIEEHRETFADIDGGAIQDKLVELGLKSKQKWTTARPTVAGWYWLRAPSHGWRDAVVWIDKDGDGPESYCYLDDEDSTPVEEIDGEWQGPLTPGEE